MLIGYNPLNYNIEFLFSDSIYLNKMFPNNTAKISNFWKNVNHNLVEMFVDEKDFIDYKNYPLYKVINGKILKKETIKKEQTTIEPKIIKIENKTLENNKQSVNINGRSLNSSIKNEVKYE